MQIKKKLLGADLRVNIDELALAKHPVIAVSMVSLTWLSLRLSRACITLCSGFCACKRRERMTGETTALCITQWELRKWTRDRSFREEEKGLQ